MRKRFMAIFLVFIMVAALLPASALAYTNDSEQVYEIVDEANARIEEVVEFFQESPLPGYLAAQLAKHITDGIARVAIERCERLGATVICVEEPIVIKGYTVMIDPLIVISL